jgi:hypothetical protein
VQHIAPVTAPAPYINRFLQDNEFPLLQDGFKDLLNTLSPPGAGKTIKNIPAATTVNQAEAGDSRLFQKSPGTVDKTSLLIQQDDDIGTVLQEQIHVFFPLLLFRRPHSLQAVCRQGHQPVTFQGILQTAQPPGKFKVLLAHLLYKLLLGKHVRAAVLFNIRHYAAFS